MNHDQVSALRTRLAGAIAGRFEVGDLLGAGGFAAVFRARDPLLGREVAIKVLSPELTLSGAAMEKLLEEARLVASIEHPHIVPLYEAGSADGLVYLVMRYYPDGTLGTHLARTGPLPAADVTRIGLEVADALAAAHARGVVHLDIKPDNILLDGASHAAVADFGIARVIAGSPGQPTGLVSGSPHYMSPEQVAGDSVDGRSDVYALGVTLYELVTGRRPITGNSAQTIMANQVREAPVPLSSVAPQLPTALAQVITRALAKDPAARFPGAKDMAEGLRQAGTPDRLLTPAQAARRVRRRWYAGMAVLATGVLAGIILIGRFAFSLLRNYGSGHPPAIDAVGNNISPVMLDSLLAHGIVPPGDSTRYVFAQNGRTLADGLVITNREVIVMHNWEPKRFVLAEDPNITLALQDTTGFVIIRPREGAAPDTVLSGMSGVEQQVLMLALKRVLP